MLVLTWECLLDLYKEFVSEYQSNKEKINLQRSRKRSHLLILCMTFISRPPLPLVSRQMLSME
jgi:hypothetical protein